MGAIFQGRHNGRMPQEALRCERHQRLSPASYDLPPEYVEVLGRRARHHDLQIVLGRQRQKSFQLALECSGPWPSKPWGNNITKPLKCRHLFSALAMN